MKKCGKCKELKALDTFGKNKSRKDGLTGYCKACVRITNKEIYRPRYAEKITKIRKKYYLKNKESIIKQTNKYNFNRDEGLHRRYWSMVRRCRPEDSNFSCTIFSYDSLYKSASNYMFYGGNGIEVDWNNYISFKEDMQDSFIKHCKQYGVDDTTLDRIDPFSNYSKENCRWATRNQQRTENKRDMT